MNCCSLEGVECSGHGMEWIGTGDEETQLTISFRGVNVQMGDPERDNILSGK